MFKFVGLNTCSPSISLFHFPTIFVAFPTRILFMSQSKLRSLNWTGPAFVILRSFFSRPSFRAVNCQCTLVPFSSFPFMLLFVLVFYIILLLESWINKLNWSSRTKKSTQLIIENAFITYVRPLAVRLDCSLSEQRGVHASKPVTPDKYALVLSLQSSSCFRTTRHGASKFNVHRGLKTGPRATTRFYDTFDRRGPNCSHSMRSSYTPFTRWSWLDELARRALDERSSSQIHRVGLNGVLLLGLRLVFELVTRVCTQRIYSSDPLLHRGP